MNLPTDFDQWKLKEIHLDKEFIEDGIIDSDNWESASPRILFLAKEAYTGNKGFDLRKLIRDEKTFGNWNTVADWTYAITKIWEDGKIPDYRPVELTKDLNSWLKKIAFVNIKKSNGSSSSDHFDLMKYIESDKELLRLQIDAANPDIILCCYTYEPGFYDRIYEDENIECFSEWCLHHEINGKQRLVIDYWHFANRYPGKMAYFALCAILIKYQNLKSELST